jgi:hypothetical protein
MWFARMLRNGGHAIRRLIIATDAASARRVSNSMAVFGKAVLDDSGERRSAQ